jgi:phosphatidylethanolamine-binding protein (PEBP) family uncharacterized protein
MEIIYPSMRLYKNNLFLSIEESSVEPIINLNYKLNSFYTLLMFDPDAVGGNKIHWLIVNITQNDITIGNTIVKYKGPKPPKDSGKHHYVISLFRQHKLIDPWNIVLNSRFIELEILFSMLKRNNNYFTLENIKYFVCKKLKI